MTLVELLGAAAEQGEVVSPDQFRRWRAYGLVHAPTLTSKGRGRGVEATYDASHLAQVVAIAAAFKRDRKRKRVLWSLWIRGYQIDLKEIRRCLKSTLRECGQLARRVKQGTDTDGAATRFEKLLTNGRPGPLLGPVRRRLGKAKFNSVAIIVLQALTGQYDSNDPSNDSLILEAFGMSAPSSPSGPARNARLGFLQPFSVQLRPDRLAVGLRGVTDDELLEVRKVLVGLLPVMRDLVDAAVAAFPELRTFASKALLAETHASPFAVPPPFVFLAFLGARISPELKASYAAARAVVWGAAQAQSAKDSTARSGG